MHMCGKGGGVLQEFSPNKFVQNCNFGQYDSYQPARYFLGVSIDVPKMTLASLQWWK